MKALSLITLEREQPKFNAYLSKTNYQTGFRRGHGTAEAVLAHKIIILKALKYQWKPTILGIDLSQAFDTVNRSLLLDVLKNKVGICDDSLHIIKVLLSNTTAQIKLNGKLSDPFKTNIGVPQGDGLSPVLFPIYLEAAMDDLPSTLKSENLIQSTNIFYADDCDFINCDVEVINAVKSRGPEILARWNLKMNPDKTEEFQIDNKLKEWKHSKKLGTILGETEELEARMNKATQKLYECKALWKKKHGMSEMLKIRLFKVFIQSVLLYNCGTWALTRENLEKLERFQRNTLRKILNIHYPNKISRKAIYKRTKVEKLEPQIAKARLDLFGKMLRGDCNSPALFWLREYFDTTNLKARRGKICTNLLKILQQDMKDANYCLNNTEDLNKLIYIARRQSETWSAIVERVLMKANERSNLALKPTQVQLPTHGATLRNMIPRKTRIEEANQRMMRN
jgi:hypothetical protein